MSCPEWYGYQAVSGNLLIWYGSRPNHHQSPQFLFGLFPTSPKGSRRAIHGHSIQFLDVMQYMLTPASRSHDLSFHIALNLPCKVDPSRLACSAVGFRDACKSWWHPDSIFHKSGWNMLQHEAKLWMCHQWINVLLLRSRLIQVPHWSAFSSLFRRTC